MYRTRFYYVQTACRILRDIHLAQDVVQEAFLKVANNFEKIKNLDCNKRQALFVIIVRNLSIDIYREKRKQQELSLQEMNLDLPASDPGVEDILLTNESFSIIAEKIEELHPSYADILALKYFYHYTDQEIAKMLNITLENTRTRLHRARRSLRKLLLADQEVV
ncbi:MAG: RNA polymerase sigma factor [Desulfitobacteriia bacterium]